MDSIKTSELVNNYSSKFLDALPDGHNISSPLGMWVLLSLIAPSLEGEEREEMEAILGAPAEQLSIKVQHLFNELPSDLFLSFAFWFREHFLHMSNVDNFLKNLPAIVEVENSISQEHADSWANEKTLGIIDKFPEEITAETAFIFASALATKIKWKWPFTTTTPITTGKFAEYSLEGMIAKRLHYKAIFKTSYGYAGVHMAESAGEGLSEVYSIITDNPDLSQKDAQKAALEIINGKAVQVSLFDLPLGDATPWNVQEYTTISYDAPEKREEIDAVVASWSAESEYDWFGTMVVPGVPVAVENMERWLNGKDSSVKAVQAAKAKYGIEGYEAAAITYFSGFVTAANPGFGEKYEVLVRTATINFDNPYTVIATVNTHEEGNIPVFIAWVETPSAPEKIVFEDDTF
jgi:hypothetical protein